MKGLPSTDVIVSPSKPSKRDKRKLDKAPKHEQDMSAPPPPAKPSKRTARKSVANAPSVAPQKISKVGRIPKISGGSSNTRHFYIDSVPPFLSPRNPIQAPFSKPCFPAGEKKPLEIEKKRPRASDSDGSETEKQKPKRVYPLRNRSISDEPADPKVCLHFIELHSTR